MVSRRVIGLAGLCGALLAGLPEGALAAPSSEPDASLPTNRDWEVLEAPQQEADVRRTLAQAGALLGTWKVDLAGVPLDGHTLQRLARTPEQEPLLRAARELLQRPVDVEDFLFFLDDLLLAGSKGLRDKPVCITPSRARNAGFFLHPGDLFPPRRPRIYGVSGAPVNIDTPEDLSELAAAKDGDPLAPPWAARYPNPKSEEEMLIALGRISGAASFARRVELLVKQLRRQGAEVVIESTVRRRERGYLMWGAFLLSRSDTEGQLERRVAKLQRLNRLWNLNIPIAWSHPDGWRTTREAARQMADTYGVVYATMKGAKTSDHYDARAVDLSAVALPRQLELVAPQGTAKMRFDLSAPEQSRDLSLTPELIAWIEEHFQMAKLRRDYPHWNDTAPRQ